MHRLIEDRLEEILAGSASGEVQAHLEGCARCRAEVARMKEHSLLLHSLRAPEEIGPAAGFYARLTQRIEAERSSIWNVFLEPGFGRRLAFASMALAVLMGAYLVSSETAYSGEQTLEVALEDQVLPMQVADRPNLSPDPDQVLVSLASYREE